MARPLKKWLIRHRDKPYPSKAEKLALALGSHMTLEQVSNWFANARRRLKNTVYVPGMNWGDRIRQYNNFISGNTEPLSISSDDSIWDSDCGQRGGGADDGLIGEQGSSTLQGLAREGHARVQLFEHSYSATALEQKGQVLAKRGTHSAMASMTMPRSKRLRCIDGDGGPGSKRLRPSCYSESPSENDSDDESTTVGDGVEPSQAATSTTPEHRQLAGHSQASPSGTKRHLSDSEESSERMPAFKKYKTSMLLRYISDDLQDPPEGKTVSSVQSPIKPSPPMAKQPSKEQQQHVRMAKPEKAVQGQRQAAKRRKHTNEPSSAATFRWTEIEAAEALTHLSQSSALCWTQQPQQQRVS